MQRQLFPKDEVLHGIIKSDEFKKLLRTDTTTEDCQDYIAQYYDVNTDWEALKTLGREKKNNRCCFRLLLPSKNSKM
jgi:hypothetical protein